MMNDLTLGRDITHQLCCFRDFLISCWPSLDELTDNHDWENDGYLIDDWLQVNWELLVERELLGKGKWLTPLSAINYRILDENAKATYAVCTLLSVSRSDLTGEVIPSELPLRLTGFVSSLAGGGFGFYPPFDVVYLMDDNKKNIYILPFSGLSFFLKSLDV